MSDFLVSNKAVTAEEAGYTKVGALEYGVEKELLLKAEDLPAGEGTTPDLTGYVKKTDISGAASQTAGNTVKLLIAGTDGTFKAITMADLKAFITA